MVGRNHHLSSPSPVSGLGHGGVVAAAFLLGVLGCAVARVFVVVDGTWCGGSFVFACCLACLLGGRSGGQRGGRQGEARTPDLPTSCARVVVRRGHPSLSCPSLFPVFVGGRGIASMFELRSRRPSLPKGMGSRAPPGPRKLQQAGALWRAASGDNRDALGERTPGNSVAIQWSDWFPGVWPSRSLGRACAALRPGRRPSRGDAFGRD